MPSTLGAFVLPLGYSCARSFCAIGLDPRSTPLVLGWFQVLAFAGISSGLSPEHRQQCAMPSGT